jgi:hypothetical protein
MGIDSCITVEILTHVDITFFTQNKPMNNHLEDIFVGQSVYLGCNRMQSTEKMFLAMPF